MQEAALNIQYFIRQSGIHRFCLTWVCCCLFSFVAFAQTTHEIGSGIPQKKTWRKTAKSLKQAVNEQQNDFAKTNLIREFVAEFTDLHIASDSMEISILLPEWHDLPIDDIYAKFYNDEASALCGSTSKILTKVYEQFGFKSGVYCAGLSESEASHAIVLVQIEMEGEQIWIVQDPFFNFAYIDSDQSPVSFDQLINSLKVKDTAQVFKQQSIGFSNLLVRGKSNQKEQPQAKGRYELPLKTQVSRNFSNMMREESDEVQEVYRLLEAESLPQAWEYLFLLPLNADKILFTDAAIDTLLDFGGTDSLPDNIIPAKSSKAGLRSLEKE